MTAASPAAVIAWLESPAGQRWARQRIDDDGPWCYLAEVRPGGVFSTVSHPAQFGRHRSWFDPTGGPPDGQDIHPRAGYWRAPTGPAVQAGPPAGREQQWAK